MEKFTNKNFRKNDFLDSSLYNQIYDFIKEYDSFYEKDVMASYKKWLRDEDFDQIRHFLEDSTYESNLGLSLEDFNNFKIVDFLNYQMHTKKVQELINRKKTLLYEFVYFYN